MQQDTLVTVKKNKANNNSSNNHRTMNELDYKIRCMGKNEINAILHEFCPDLKGPFGQYPMEATGWQDALEMTNPPNHLKGVVPSSQPTFIPPPPSSTITATITSKNLHQLERKHDYVFGYNRLRGLGYYHLLTLAGQIIIYERLRRDHGRGFRSVIRCAVSRTARQKRQRYKIAQRILRNRTSSMSANDVEAQQSAAKGGSSNAGSGTSTIGFGLAALAI